MTAGRGPFDDGRSNGFFGRRRRGKGGDGSASSGISSGGTRRRKRFESSRGAGGRDASPADSDGAHGFPAQGTSGAHTSGTSSQRPTASGQRAPAWERIGASLWEHAKIIGLLALAATLAVTTLVVGTWGRSIRYRSHPVPVSTAPSLPTSSLPIASDTPPIDSGVPSLQCSAYAVIAVRGSGEQADDEQLLRPVGEQITAELDDAAYVDLDYPASFDLRSSGQQGVGALVQLVSAWAQDCPQTRFVLLGYSQGAMVVTNALMSPGERRWNQDAPALPSEVTERVDAVVLYGDPGFVGSEPFNSGDYDPGRDGWLARSPGTLEAYASRIRSFCVGDDLFCQAGTGSLSGHLEYFSNGMREQGAQFVLEQVTGSSG